MKTVFATLAIAASVDAQAVTIRPDLGADTQARLELLERMRASRGIRYFATSNPMPTAVVVQAAPVTRTVTLPAAPPAPAVQVNCIPSAQAAPAAPAAPAPIQSLSYQQQTIGGSVGTAPIQSLMSRVSSSVASRSRSSVLQALFDARSLRIYGVAPGTAPVTTITPLVTLTQAAPAPAAPSAPVCVPTESAKPDAQAASPPDAPTSSPPTGPSGGSVGTGSGDAGSGGTGFDEPPALAGSALPPESPFLDEGLLPGFGGGEGGGEGSEGSEGGADGNSGSTGTESLPPSLAMALAAPPTDVPEPGSLALLGLGLLGLGAARRRRP